MRKLLLVLLFFGILGCASYQSKVADARRQMADGQPLKAAEMLEAKANEPGKDQVLFLMDYGLALHEARDFKKSNDVLIQADRLAEVKDYVSLGRQAGSLFVNESLIQYKSERFENILINAYLALNFTLQGNYESALVECRRMDEKIIKMKRAKEDVRKNFYARYLSAMIWEAQKNWDSSYIDYVNAYKIRSNLKQFRKDLIRAAWKARRYKDLKKWQKEFPEVKLAEIKKQDRTMGELVYIYQQGWIPRKRPRPENFRFPHLVRKYVGLRSSYLNISGKKYPATERLYNVGDEAIRTLNDDYKYLVAKKMLGIVAKEVVADQIRQKDKTLGALAAIAMHAADQADLRQWSTLPDSFQISRIKLKPGKHVVKVYATGPSGETLVKEQTVTIQKGKKTFITQRTFY
ncbi:MAG: hypothetical protein HRT44_07925 [Bdellovibrionales bacterium]|nr:hypothetical protein [Bdellovibrionales bacterium]NQZ19166.1 hypothetical protein [Bdellovibrionales bacterium]